MKDYKKSLCTSIIPVLLILTILITNKYTFLGNYSVSVNFIIYPFIFLFNLLLLEFYNKKESYLVVINSTLIQLVLILFYLLITKLGNQNTIVDNYKAINEVFNLNIKTILSILSAFLLSNYLLIYIYDYYKAIRKKLLGSVLSNFVSILIFGLITIICLNSKLNLEVLNNLLISHLLVTILFTILNTIMFMIIKGKDNI